MDYTTDELPLPSFVEIFGDGAVVNTTVRKKKKSSSGNKVEVNGEESTGRWTPEEHRLFLEGIMLYGKDWKKMQPLIKTRSLVQIRTHAQKVFKKIGLKKIGNGMKRRPSNGKEGETAGDQELEDVLDDELEHLGMMENVDETMLNSLHGHSSHHGIIIPPQHAHLMHNHGGIVMSPHGSIQHPSPHNSGHSYTSNAPPNLHLDLHHHSTDMMGGHLQIGTPMMSHHQENVFDSLHESQK